MKILGIESSCDDTGVAIVDDDGRILSNCIHSQIKQHVRNGGIIPIMAKEYHMDNIDLVANEAFKKSGLKSVANDIDAIAVSNRPGLKYPLQIGLNYARTLAKKYSKPLIPIHHMQAHSLMGLMQNKSIRFPYMTLLISGGHCLLSIAKRYNEFHILGESKDEAPGDMLDKAARRFRLRDLGPPYDSICGGAAVELLSRRPRADRFRFNDSQCWPSRINFSFSGFQHLIEEQSAIVDQLWLDKDKDRLLDELSHFCASIQRLITIQFIRKVYRAVYYYRMSWRHKNEDAFASSTPANFGRHVGFDVHKNDEGNGFPDLVISGGVASNSYIVNTIRTICAESIDQDMKVYSPSRNLCSDNGVMVAWNGILRYREYLESGRCRHPILNERVISDFSEMDCVREHSICPIGVSLDADIKNTGFQLQRLIHPEIQLGS